MLCFFQRNMALFGFAEEFFVLHAKDDGVGFDHTGVHNMGDDFIFGLGTVLAQEIGDHFFDRAGLIAPFSQTVNTPPDEDEAVIFDELVVYRLHMGVAVVESRDIDELCDFAKMLGLAFFLEDEERFVAHATRLDLRPFRQTDFIENILADVL